MRAKERDESEGESESERERQSRGRVRVRVSEHFSGYSKDFFNFPTRALWLNPIMLKT